MIPGSEDYGDTLYEEEESGFSMENEPSLTYAMQLTDAFDEDDFFVGKADDEEAIRQAILKIINTERYEYEIYSWDYGIELRDLFGMDMPYVMSEVKQRITDALTADDRIESVDNFEMEITAKHTLYCKFTANTAQGDKIKAETEVDV